MTPKLEIIWVDDESADIYYDDTFLININHEEHGWSGMEAIQNSLTTLANAVDIEVVVTGDPAI